MNKNVFLWIILGFVALYAVVVSSYAISVSVHQKKIEADLTQSQKMRERIVEELIDLQEEREAIQENNERINAELISHLAQQEKWKTENKELQSQMEELSAKSGGDDEQVDQLKKKIQALKIQNARLEKESTEPKKVSGSENSEALSKRVKTLEAKSISERAVFYFNLGVAYDRGKLEDEALKAYKKSIEINPKYSAAYYNLGILYEEVFMDDERALENYEKFLKLNPNGEEAAQVRAWSKAIRAKVQAAYGE